jgi:xylulokinase
MHGATLLDASDRGAAALHPLERHPRPCEAAAMDADPRWRAVTGNIVFPGFTAPKLAWVRRHEPDSFDRVAKVLLPKDYLRLWLTGEHVAEMSDAAGTSWLDTGARDWSEDLLAATGLTAGQMPRLVEGSEVSGTLRASLAKRWGCPGNARGGRRRRQCRLGRGHGHGAAGQAFVSLGTSGVLFAAMTATAPIPRPRCTPSATPCRAPGTRWA